MIGLGTPWMQAYSDRAGTDTFVGSNCFSGWTQAGGGAACSHQGGWLVLVPRGLSCPGRAGHDGGGPAVLGRVAGWIRPRLADSRERPWNFLLRPGHDWALPVTLGLWAATLAAYW